MTVDGKSHRFLRLVTAALVFVAAMAWASLAPLHADGPALQPIKVAPCHEHAPVQKDLACDALCAVAAPSHFLGEVTCAPQFDAAKLALPSVATVIATPRPARDQTYPPAVRRSDGPPLYLTTQRLRI